MGAGSGTETVRRQDDGPNGSDVLETDGLLEDLQGHSVRSGAVRIVAQALQALIAVGTGIALAHLLTPADFGVFAMAFTLIGFVSWFRDFGLPLALTQRAVLNEREVRALSRAAIKLTLGLVLFVALMGPAVALFYGEGRVRAAVWVMSVGVLGLGLCIVQEGILIRRMRFGALALIETVAVVVSAILALTAASLGAGYWALVVQFLALAIAKSVGVWLASGWRIGRPDAEDGSSPDTTEAVRSMLRYGRDLTAARILHYFGMNTDRILIGYVHGSGPLGLYDNSLRWSRYPMRQVFLPLQNVVVSTLSRIQDDPRRYRNAFRKGTLTIYSVILPLLAYLITDAPNVILVLLGDQWLEAVPLFRLLAFATVAHSVRRATTWLYVSEGRTSQQLRWMTIAAPLQIGAVVVGLRWGVSGVALAFAASAWILVVPEILYCTRKATIRIQEFWGMVWRPGLGSLIASLLVVTLWPALLSNVPVTASDAEALRGLLWRAPVFFTAYVATWLILPGGRAAGHEVMELSRLLVGSSSSGGTAASL